MLRRLIRFSAIAAILLLVIQSARGGLEKSAADKSKSRENLYSQIELFADAVSVIRNEYVDEIDSKKLMYGAMRGMLESLDDYSQFMDPDEYNEIKVETKGEFGGIGVEISLKEGILTIITPMVGTPADIAGIKAGDKIIKIDGKVTKNITLNDAVKQMRGKPGSVVTLTIWREDLPRIIDVPIKREIIKVNSIKKAEILEDKIGYIRLVEFQENTMRDLDDAIKKLKSAGMDSLILDLRNNPGGLLDGAIDVAERFLPKDAAIVSIKARAQDQTTAFKSSGKFANKDLPIILIVNEGSASASEIVAGAIKDNKRGIVLGMKTFGKASVQTVIPLNDGSALRFTTACYLTPSGKLIKDEGIMPDVVVAMSGRVEKKKGSADDIFDKMDEASDVKAAKDKPAEVAGKPAKVEAENDSQLAAAVNLMKAIRIYKGNEGS